MGDDRLDQLRQKLASAKTVMAYKKVHNEALVAAEGAAAAQDYPLLDELSAIRMISTRRGGLLILNGADHQLGAEACALWEKRASLNEREWDVACRRVATLARRRAGEVPSPPRPAQSQGDESSQSRTVLSSWRVDEFGNAVRYVAGVDLRRYRQLLAMGRDPQSAEAELLAQALATPNRAEIRAAKLLREGAKNRGTQGQIRGKKAGEAKGRGKAPAVTGGSAAEPPVRIPTIAAVKRRSPKAA